MTLNSVDMCTEAGVLDQVILRNFFKLNSNLKINVVFAQSKN